MGDNYFSNTINDANESIDRETAIDNLAIAIIDRAVRDAIDNPERYYNEVIRFLKGPMYEICTNLPYTIIKNFIDSELKNQQGIKIP